MSESEATDRHEPKQATYEELEQTILDQAKQIRNLKATQQHATTCAWHRWDWRYTWSKHDCTCGEGRMV